ncbi:MAG: hypothetical protein C4348_00570 [Patescibacteria group bacterium]
MSQNQEKCERFYIPLEEARALLEERRQQGWTLKVEEYWRKKRGIQFPEELSNLNDLAGFLARHLATARYEDFAFILLTKRAGLKPTWLTYTADRFVTCSPVKVSYLCPKIVTGFGRRGGPILRKYRLANPRVAERKRLCDIRINTGKKLVDWHRRRLEAVYPGANVVDFSRVFQARGNAQGYYPLFLSLAVAHGVLFEDFHGGESGERLNSFTKEVFEPAFDEVTNTFGVQPLIVKLPWWPELGYYPSIKLATNWRNHRSILKDLLS